VLTIGSLCSGYGGLEMGVQAVLNADLSFVADIGSGARKVLARRYPGVPNAGDLTTVDWAEVMSGKPPVDMLVAGFPLRIRARMCLRRAAGRACGKVPVRACGIRWPGRSAS
jgi:site-specific DNA-cytosine methylase